LVRGLLEGSFRLCKEEWISTHNRSNIELGCKRNDEDSLFAIAPTSLGASCAIVHARSAAFLLTFLDRSAKLLGLVVSCISTVHSGSPFVRESFSAGSAHFATTFP